MADADEIAMRNLPNGATVRQICLVVRDLDRAMALWSTLWKRSNLRANSPTRSAGIQWRPCRPVVLHLLRESVEALDDARPIDDEPVAADDVPDAGVVDLAQPAPG